MSGRNRRAAGVAGLLERLFESAQPDEPAHAVLPSRTARVICRVCSWSWVGVAPEGIATAGFRECPRCRYLAGFPVDADSPGAAT